MSGCGRGAGLIAVPEADRGVVAALRERLGKDRPTMSNTSSGRGAEAFAVPETDRTAVVAALRERLGGPGLRCPGGLARRWGRWVGGDRGRRRRPARAGAEDPASDV